MARFKYLGKKKEFMLDKQYSYQTPLNPGDEFELTGPDIVLMKRCLKVAGDNGIAPENRGFVLAAQYELDTAEAPKATTPDYESLTVKTLKGLLEERGHTFDKYVAKAELIKLLTNPSSEVKNEEDLD